MKIKTLTKAHIRRACLAKRNNLNQADHTARSHRICIQTENYLKNKNWIASHKIAGYMPMLSEANIKEALLFLHQHGAQLCLPAFLDKDQIIFRRFRPDDRLIAGAHATKCPSSDQPIMEPSLLLVPLVGFDNTGARLGYGKGHYDRALAKLEQKKGKPITIGIAFSCQKVDHIPTEAHDHRLTTIITEDGVLEFNI